MTVSVGIQQIKCRLVKLQAGGRAAQGGPKLLVELAEVSEIIGGLEQDLSKAAHSDKTPVMTVHRF